MADEQNTDDTHRATRQGWALNDKQVKYGGGILASLYIVAQLKGALWTREEGVAEKDKLAAVVKSVDDLKKTNTEQAQEIIRVVERKTDKLIDMVDKQEARTQRDIDRITARVDNLEFITGPKKKGN
jgi:hypothetical protein